MLWAGRSARAPKEMACRWTGQGWHYLFGALSLPLRCEKTTIVSRSSTARSGQSLAWLAAWGGQARTVEAVRNHPLAAFPPSFPLTRCLSTVLSLHFHRPLAAFRRPFTACHRLFTAFHRPFAACISAVPSLPGFPPSLRCLSTVLSLPFTVISLSFTACHRSFIYTSTVLPPSFCSQLLTSTMLPTSFSPPFPSFDCLPPFFHCLQPSFRPPLPSFGCLPPSFHNYPPEVTTFL